MAMFVAKFVARMAVLAAAALCATLPADAKTLRWASQGDALTLDPHSQNEGPTTAMNSPSPTVKSIRSSATTVPRGVPYSLRRPFTLITSADRAIAPPQLYFITRRR